MRCSPSTTSSQPVGVQTLSGLQTRGTPGTQPLPATQVSAPSQTSPSSQASGCGVCTHPALASSQASAVQAIPSSQSGGAPGLQPAVGTHVSTPSQNSPSEHSASARQYRQAPVVPS